MRIATAFAWLFVLCSLSACGGEAQSPAPVSGASGPGPRADVALGGQLYDKFWKAVKAPAPTTTHPLWSRRPDMESNARAGADTWRCKECHGWDYKGVDGAYAEGSHRTGFPGLLGSTASDAELVTSIADTHGYRAAGLGEAEIDSLVRFVREDLVDCAQVIDEQGAFRGNAERGRQLYLQGLGGAKSCSSCHGPKGLKPPRGPDDAYEDFVGKIATENPWEFLHKVRFGQPGTQMPAAVTAEVPMQDLLDVGAYAQTLPKAP